MQPEYVPILLSAANREDLLREVIDLSRFIGSLIDRNTKADAAALSDIAARASVQSPQCMRLAISVDSLDNLLRTLSRLQQKGLGGEWMLHNDSAEMSQSRVASQKIAFLYPGQGSQRYGENSQLANVSREYTQRVKALEEGFSPIDVGGYLSREWSDIPNSRPLDEAIATTEIAQSMLTVLGMSTSDVLAQLGVEPGLALGHSVGEFGAAYASGFIDEDEARMYLQARIRCMKDFMVAGEFGMLAIGLGVEEVESLMHIPKGVSVSSDNSTRQVVYAGPKAAIEELAAEAGRLDIRNALLKTQNAFHTPYQDAADKAFQRFLIENPRKSHPPSGVTLISSVSGQVVPDADECWALLGVQISRPVLFRSALTVLAEHEPTVLIQLYGGRSLISMYKAVNPGFDGVEIAFGGADDGKSRQLSENLCKLYLAVESFDGSTILARRGIAALGHKHMTDNESVRLHNTRKRDIAVADNSRNDDEALLPSTQTRARECTAVPLTADAAINSSSYTQELLDLFAGQVALLRESRSGIQGSASIAPILRSEPIPRFVPMPMPMPMPMPTSAPIPVAPTSVEAGGHTLDEIADVVIQTIALQAGYSTAEVGLNDSLGEGLGLDSLIVADTAQRLHRKYERWIPQQADFSSITTVKDLAQSVASAYEAPGAVSLSISPGILDEPIEAPAPTPASEPEKVQGEALIDNFPEVLGMQDTMQVMLQGKTRNPYYLEVEGTIGSHLSIAGRQLTSFSSFNYLGMTTHPRVVSAARQAIETYGTSVSAARILSGNRPIHSELETTISRLLNVEDSIALVGGHCTNMSIIPHLLDERDIIFHDALVHDSILQGIRASGAARHSFTHNQTDELERALIRRRGQFRRALIIVEGIYSMDGDLPPLAELVDLKERFGATLMVDEAHSIGVLGKGGGGVCEELGVDPTKVDILMGTLSKSFASCGGYLAGSRSFIQSLRYSLSGYIFSTGMTPANTAAALEAIRVMRDEPERLIRLRQNATYFLARATEMKFNCGTAVGVPVVPTILGDSATTLAVANFMFENGVSVNPILFPAVAESLARLRFFITSEHTPKIIDETLSILQRAVQSTKNLAA